MSDEPDIAVAQPVLPAAPDLDETKMAVLARDMAWAVKDPAVILAEVGITQEQFNTYVMTNAFYKRAFETYLIEWNAASTVNKRIAIKAAAGLEEALMPLAERMTNAKENLTAQVETAKLFAKIAGADGERKGPADGEKFTININLGTKQLHYEETLGTTTPAGEIQEVPEGQRNSTPLQLITKRD